MKTTLKEYTVEEISEGFVYNELEGKGLFGLSGRLTIQPGCFSLGFCSVRCLRALLPSALLFFL